jgi:hypothetical protein
MVWKVVRIGDRLVGMFVRQPLPTVDSLEPEFDERHVPANGSEFQALRNVLYSRWIGQRPNDADLGRLCDLELEWSAVLSRPMMLAVMTCKDADIHGHMSGRRRIRGVVPYESVAVEEVRIGLLKEKARIEAAKRVPPFRYA